jgi:hypothetical protein
MPPVSYGKSTSINFQGKSGQSYRFQAWPMDTKFKGIGGIYLVTRRECLDRTFPTKATHRCLAIGQTADLAASALSKAELSKLIGQGANCICVYAVADEARRLEIEKDLIEGNERWGGRLHYLFHEYVPEKLPGTSAG